MSHKTSVKTKLNNKAYIIKALQNLGMKCTSAEGNTLVTEGVFRVHENVSILISDIGGKNIKNCIGFAETADGTFEATGDFWGTGYDAQKLSAAVTQEAKKLEVTDQLALLGFNAETTNTTKEGVELVFSRWA